jgi:hypothetical protein
MRFLNHNLKITARYSRLTLSSSSCASSITPHWNGLLVLSNILQVLDCALQLPAVDCLCGFAGVLEGDTEVGATSAGGGTVFNGCCCVSDHGGG